MIKVLIAPPNIDISVYSSIPDPVRQKCAELGFQTIYDIPLAHQLLVREELIDEHQQFVQGVSGDCTLTFSVFTWLADWMRWGWSAVPSDKWERILAKASTCAHRYGSIEFMATGTPLEYDGYAWLDNANAAQIYSLSRYVITLLGEESKIVP
jgi:hypothetical protein